MAKAHTVRKRKVRVGQKVTFRLFGEQRRGLVIEDRGRIGVGGRQILRIRPVGEGPDLESFELPSQDVVQVD